MNGEHNRKTALVRSLEVQLKASDEAIAKLKKEVKQWESGSRDLPTSTITTRRNRGESSRKPEPVSDEPAPLTVAMLSKSGDHDWESLNESHFEPVADMSKADEIFQRSRSTRGNLRRSLVVMPTTREESTSDEENLNLTKTYSLRPRAERRRSFQPRRYMGGHTPPSKRTLVGDPAQVQISTFNTDTAEEPEVDYDWGRIASLRESVSYCRFCENM